MDLTDVEIGGIMMRASYLWDCFRDSIGYGGMDVAAYVSGGMSVWPCGETFQEGGRDGFKENHGIDWCECETCQRVRSLLQNAKADS